MKARQPVGENRLRAGAKTRLARPTVCAASESGGGVVCIGYKENKGRDDEYQFEYSDCVLHL